MTLFRNQLNSGGWKAVWTDMVAVRVAECNSDSMQIWICKHRNNLDPYQDQFKHFMDLDKKLFELLHMAYLLVHKM